MVDLSAIRNQLPPGYISTPEIAPATSLRQYFNTLFYCEYSPMYETIRDESEFLKFIRQKENKYQVDRGKIKQLFREVGVYD